MGGQPLHAADSFRAIEMPPSLASISVPSGTHFKTVFTWLPELTLAPFGKKNSKIAHQIVIARGVYDVAQVTTIFDTANGRLFIEAIETIAPEQRRGLGTALLRGALALHDGEVKSVYFQTATTNFEQFILAFKRGNDVETSLAATHIGGVFLELGFKLITYAPTRYMLLIRPELSKHIPPPGYHKIDEPFFWLAAPGQKTEIVQ